MRCGLSLLESMHRSSSRPSMNWQPCSRLTAAIRHQDIASGSIKGNPEQLSDDELAVQARSLIARRAKKRASDQLKLIEGARGKDLASMDLAQIANAAAAGRVGTLLVDVTATVPGSINAKSGKLSLAKRPSAKNYDVLDELVGMTVRAGGEVLPVTSKMLGGEHKAAALFRFRV